MLSDIPELPPYTDREVVDALPHEKVPTTKEGRYVSCRKYPSSVRRAGRANRNSLLAIPYL